MTTALDCQLELPTANAAEVRAGCVLIVDDQKVNRDLLEHCLLREGFDVHCAQDGGEALEAVERHMYDLVLLDIMMPGVSGLEVLRLVREQYSTTQLPVIMATAKDKSDDVVEALSLGANDYVTKPIDVPVILARVGTQIHLKRTAEALAVEVAERKQAQDALAIQAKDLQAANERLLSVDRELQQMVRSLEQKNQSLEEFAAVASHDLQAPIRKVISFAELLREGLGEALTESTARDLKFILEAAHQMRSLVKNLLELARTDLARIDEVVDLNQCLDVALDALTCQITESKATIVRCKLPVVRGNRTLLTQLLQNLIGNAVKFAADIDPVVEITLREMDSQRVFGVRDNGIGIQPDKAGVIFKPFLRLHGRHEYEGTGIGLAICDRAVRRHEGRIWVDSTPSEGSHFQFTLGEDLCELDCCDR